MKVIIAGSRTINSYEEVCKAVALSTFDITEVVSGGANGVDKLGEEWARNRGVPIKQFIPNWNLGKRAGFDRNEQMAAYADALIAVHDGQSRGTAHMIMAAKKCGLEVYLHEYMPPPVPAYRAPRGL